MSAPPWSFSSQTVSLTPQSLFVASYQFSSHFWSAGNPMKNPKPTLVHLGQNSEEHDRFIMKRLLLVHNETNVPYHLSKIAKQDSAIRKLGCGRAGSDMYPPALSDSSNRFPIQPARVLQYHSAFPSKSSNIMRKILSYSSCDYTLSIGYDASQAMMHIPQLVYLKIGFLGWPGLVDWTLTFKCDCYYSLNFCSKRNHGGTNSSSLSYDNKKYSVRRCVYITITAQYRKKMNDKSLPAVVSKCKFEACI